MKKRAFYLIAYDLSDNKRRAKLAKLLESLGARVQGSVFEIWLTRRELEDLLRKARRVLNEEEDSLRVYFLCEECRKKIYLHGRGERSQAPEVMII